MKRQEFCSLIDASVLWQNRSEEAIIQRSKEVIQYGFACICCYPTDVAIAKKIIGKQANISGVVGFPIGFETIETKIRESLYAIDEGANEIDFVINVAEFKRGNFAYVEKEIKQVVQAIKNKKSDCIVKVIIETPHLQTDDELAKAIELVIDSGADFVKNATGFAVGFDGGGAGPYHDVTVEPYENTGIDNVKRMSEIVDGRINIKASGNPKNLEECLYYVEELGVTRIGNDYIAQWLEEAGDEYWLDK